MGKHARKRQRTDTSAQEVQPLGSQVSLTDEASKDDEERRLESLLFGVPFVPSGKNDKNILVISNEEEELGVGVDGGNELENMLDTDLFYVDEGAPPILGGVPELDIGFDEMAESGGANEEAPSESADGPSSSNQNKTTLAPPRELPLHKGRKGPAWVDLDDTTLTVSLASDKRLRKLRDALSEDAVGGREYERRLRRQYEKINPTPTWAANARKKLYPKRRRSVGASSASEEEDEDHVENLLSSTNGILGASINPRVLPQNTLAIERLRDANQAAQSEGEIKTVRFHPSPQVPVLMTAGADRRVRLFNIDGHTNPHLQTLHIPALPLTTAHFHPSGSSILLTGPRPFYYTYDLQSGATHRSPRGLWGTTFNHSNPKIEDSSMEICAFNPMGDVLAVAGRRGYIHLVDWKSGAGQVVGSLKMNAGVKSLWWTKGGSGEGRELMSLSDNAEVYVWDVAGRKCTRRWQDDGGFGSRVIHGDRVGKYLAVGANNGFVNVYGSEGSSSFGTDRPKPLKTIGNLTTSISTLQFNHDSQLLAIASNAKKDQMRMIHLPSLTAFSNWPTSSTPLGHITSIDFSAGSEYVAMGNNRGRVLLYHLRNFSAQ